MFSRLPGITSEVVSSLFLFHWVLRCFTSPGARRTPMYSVHDNAAFPALGYPIRIFPDHRLLATSPELFAGCYVLLRRALSSHPPYALMLYNHSQPRLRLVKIAICRFTSAVLAQRRIYLRLAPVLDVQRHLINFSCVAFTKCICHLALRYHSITSCKSRFTDGSFG